MLSTGTRPLNCEHNHCSCHKGLLLVGCMQPPLSLAFERQVLNRCFGTEFSEIYEIPIKEVEKISILQPGFWVHAKNNTQMGRSRAFWIGLVLLKGLLDMSHGWQQLLTACSTCMRLATSFKTILRVLASSNLALIDTFCKVFLGHLL